MYERNWIDFVTKQMCIIFSICRGKKDRKDIYQAPYVWAQFLNPKPNVLINVICRAYAENIDFDKKTSRGLTRFQIYVNDEKRRSSQSAGEI